MQNANATTTTSIATIVATKAARGEVQASEEALKTLHKLDCYDLSFITGKFGVDSGIECMPEQVYMIKALVGRSNAEIGKQLEMEFKRWVALKIIDPVNSIAPSRAVDMYWHLFMLHTKEYSDFCKPMFGCYMGHAPTTDETAAEATLIGKRTKESYLRLYGTVDSTILLLRTNNVMTCSRYDQCKSDCQGTSCVECTDDKLSQ